MTKITHEHDDTDNAQVSDAIATLRNSVRVPPTDPARERALMAAFDAHRPRPRFTAGRWVWTSAAALMAVTVALNWYVVRHSPSIKGAASAQSFDSASFVPWPGADAFPPFESGSLVRVNLPVSALPALGLSAPLSAAAVVQADVVIGQDGLARAIRLVQ